MKVQISVDDELMEQIDTYADEMYMSRSGFVTMCCAQYIKSLEFQTTLSQLAVTMRRIADNNEIDEQSRNELASLETLVKMINQKH